MGIQPLFGFADPFSSWSHLLTAALALIGTGVLITKGRGNGARLASLIIYSIALVFLFSMSGVYHILEHGTLARAVLQRLDHAGIWTLIASTFAPIHVILFRGHRRWLILLLVWIVAITALVLETVFFKDVPQVLLLSLFIGLGWVGALSGFHFKKIYGDPSLGLLTFGGVFYTVGAITDFANWPTLVEGFLGPHEVFHVLIIAAAGLHWLFIYRWCDHPITNSLTFEVFVSKDRIVAKSLRENMQVEADTVEEIKVSIRNLVDNRYHSAISPEITLRFFQVETL